jgi:hypothetical protein
MRVCYVLLLNRSGAIMPKAGRLGYTPMGHNNSPLGRAAKAEHRNSGPLHGNDSVRGFWNNIAGGWLF